MTKRDFFILILKLFGLYMIVASLFSGLPGSLAYAFTDLNLFIIGWLVGTALVMFGLFALLIFYAGKVVDLLGLHEGFDDERIEFGNLDGQNIIKLAAILTGGLLIVENIPAFLSHSFYAFKKSIDGIDYGVSDNFYWAVSGLNVILGYLLISNHTLLVKLIQSDKRGDS